MVSDDAGRLEPDISDTPDLIRRALRAKVWHRVKVAHRATLKVVSWVVRRGDEGFVSRVKRNGAIRRMVSEAAKAVCEALRAACKGPSFISRALLEGARIANQRLQAYAEHGVFRWAPWVQGWLRQRDVVLYLGSASLDCGYAGRS